MRHAWPALVPNQRVLLFTIDTMAVDGAHGVMGAVSLEAAGSGEVSRWRTLVAGVDVARAAAADTIVFSRGAEIEAIAFDPLRVATAGVPRAVVAPVGTAQGLAQFAVSPTGSPRMGRHAGIDFRRATGARVVVAVRISGRG